MKIVCIDNFDRETHAHRLVASNISNKEEARLMLDALQATCDDRGSDWYVMKEDDYTLWRGIAEFVDTDENEFFE